MILSFYAQVRKSDVEIIITQENAFVNDETEKSENMRKERENSEISRSFFGKVYFMENWNLPQSGLKIDGKSKISHNFRQSADCVFTATTRAREARSIFTHEAVPRKAHRAWRYKCLQHKRNAFKLFFNGFQAVIFSPTYHKYRRFSFICLSKAFSICLNHDAKGILRTFCYALRSDQIHFKL